MKIEFESNLLAVMPERLSDIVSIRQNAAIENVNIEDAMNRRATKFKDVKGKVVVVPIHGFISHKATIWSAMGFETSSETLAGWMDDLTSNSNVGAIVLDIDSPGGTVMGLSGVTDKIHGLRGKKPIIAVVNDLMASAAYFIGSAADEIVADPDSMTGCIGTIAVHTDYSKMLEGAGIDVTIFKSAKYKDEGNPYKPLSDDAKEEYQSMVDSYSDIFVNAVARNRGVTASKVKSDFGQGRVLMADKAKLVGMVDRIATFNQVITDLLPKSDTKAKARSEVALLELTR